jgi:phage terminase small subunit
MPRPRSNRPRKPAPRLPNDVATAAELRGMTPLEYMLAVMRNPKTSQRRRDRMAVTAARYLHPRPADVGKKELRDEAARLAGGGEWFEDLEYSDDRKPQ